MIWFWGLLVLVVVLLLCTWILIFIIDFRSCSNLICTSDIQGIDGDQGEKGQDAGPGMIGPFGAQSVITGKQGIPGAPKKGPKGAASFGGTITGPKGPKGRTGDPPHTFHGIFFDNTGASTFGTGQGLLTSDILLNYYEEYVTKCPLNFMTNGTEFPIATLSFVRFGRQVTLGVVIGDIRPELLFYNERLSLGRGNLQPNYIQFSTSVLNRLARFFVVRTNAWQVKLPVQVLFSSIAEASADKSEVIQDPYRMVVPAQLLIRTQVAQILMQLYAGPSQQRFCTTRLDGLPIWGATTPALNANFYGLFGIQVSFYATWNLLL